PGRIVIPDSRPPIHTRRCAKANTGRRSRASTTSMATATSSAVAFPLSKNPKPWPQRPWRSSDRRGAEMNFARFTRWQAAPIHLLISAAIATAVVSSMLLLWYPRPFFAAAGGATLLVLLIGVDVVLGPLLTLVVYDPRKKTLALDLAIIAALQLAALAYGV